MNIPGLGHPIHKVTDPRTEVVREVAESEGLIGPSVELLERIRERASLIVGRQLVMNVDGLMAALLRDMGFTPGQILATNIWSAMPGIAAHAIEEACNGRRLRFPADHESAYTLPEQTLEWHQSRIDTAEANVSSVDTAEQEQAP
jgi:citrate synthase